MKTSPSKFRFAAYVAALVAISALSIITILRYERNAISRQPAADSRATARAAYGQLPLSFQENLGQADSRVRFVSRGSGYELFLTPDEAVLALRQPVNRPASIRERAAALRGRSTAAREAASILRVRFAGANAHATLAGAQQLPGRTDYFTGSDRSKWRTGVPSYQRVEYSSIYPGIDLVFYGNQRRLEYDFIVAPHADPKSVALEIDGATRLRTDANGNLLMTVPGGDVELHKPLVYQTVGGARREVSAAYALAGPNRVAFNIPNYDRNLPLVVDPVLNYSTYLGGSADDAGNAIAVDGSGNAFIAGQTFSTDFPTTAGAFNKGPITAGQAVNGTVFVTELNPTGTSELYSTYLTGSGGTGSDGAFGIALDGNGNVYVVGSTFSTDFPTTANALNPGPEGVGVNTVGTAFLSKVNPSASPSLVYSTFLGGTGGDAAGAVAADANGNAYVVGFTLSSDFRTMNPLPNPLGLPSAGGSAFITRIDTTKSGDPSLIYSTVFGGDGANANTNGNAEGFGEFALGVAADSSGHAYVTGITTSSGSTFPTTTGALQTSANSNNTTGGAFFSEFNTNGTGATALLYSTLLEGSTLDEANAIAIGPGGVAYIVGDTASSDFPALTNTTVNGTVLNNGVFPSAPSAQGIAFLSLVDPSKTTPAALKYGVLLGGTDSHDIAFGVKADASGNAYLAGGASSKNFPTTPGAFEVKLLNVTNGDAFVAKINPAGNGTADLVYSSYFGGSGTPGTPDVASAIAIDSAPSPGPNAFITGQTASASTASGGDFVVTANAFSTTLNGPSDAFVAELSLVPTVSVSPTSINFGTVQVGTTTNPQTVTITNNNLSALTFAGSPFTFVGTNPGDFAAVAGGATPCGAMLAKGASCTENVTFTPAAGPAPLPGPESATLDINDSDASSPQTVALSGTGSTTPPNFTITAAPTSLTVAAGATGTVTITVTPTGGFNQTVSLTCAGMPANSTCTPSPASLSFSSSNASQTSTVTIATDVSETTASVPTAPMVPPSAVPIACVLCAAAVILAATRRRRLTLGLAMLMVLLFSNCNHHHRPVTPAGTSTLNITGTSGNIVNSVPVSLTVTAN